MNKKPLTEKYYYIVIGLAVLCFGYSTSFNTPKEGGTINKMNQRIEKATLGGGCFWCVEAVFERLEGVIDVIPGYSGGLNLSNYENLMSTDAVVPGNYLSSELYIRITLPESSPIDMPPTGSLSQDEIDLIAEWIEEGALEFSDEECLLGDINNDGLTNILDVVGIVNTILSLGESLDCSDVNEDGLLNVLDVVQLVNIILL